MPKHRKSSALVRWKTIPNATGYRVFWGTTRRNYDNNYDAGNVLSYRVPNLNVGQTYFFAAKSYNQRTTSAYSNEVAFKP